MNKLISYLSGVVVAFLGLVGFYFFGKKQGSDIEKQKNIQDTLKVANEFKKTSDEVAAMSNSAVDDELRKAARDG